MDQTLNILHIEDNPADFLLVERHLRQHGLDVQCVRVDSMEGVTQALDIGTWNVILSDFSVQPLNYYDTLARIQVRIPELPVVLVCDSVNEEQVVEILKLGVYDFVPKDNLTRLIPAIERIVKESEQRIKRKTAETSLQEIEYRFRNLFNYSPIAIGVSRIDNGRLADLNDAWLQLFGFERDEVIGRTVSELNLYVRTDERSGLIQIIQDNGRVVNKPVKMRRKTGEIIDVLLSAELIALNEVIYFQAMMSDITEQKRMEGQLQINEERYRTLFVDSRDALMTLSPSTAHFLSANPATLDMFGVKDEAEFTAINPWMVSPEYQSDGQLSLEKAQEKIETALRDGYCFFEWQHKRICGDDFPAEVMLTRMEIMGELVVMASVRDLTLQKQASESFREMEQFSQQIIAHAEEGVIVYGTDLLYKVWNPYMERLCGISANDVIGKHPLELFPFLKDGGVMERLEKVLSGQSVTSVEFPFRSDFNGYVGWASDTSSALKNTQGEIVGVIAMVRDVTSRILTEETLRKMYVAVEQSPLAVVITDVVGDIEYVNPRFTLMNGYRSEEVMGLNTRVLKGDTPPDVYNNLWETLKNGSVWEGDFHNRRKDGSLFWEHDIISPINDESGTITHYMAIKEDVTERRNLEEQLRQSQKMEAVGQLAGGVAHDFNNVMQVIMGNAQLLEMRNRPHDADCHYLDEIINAVERGASLSRSLLVFSRKQHMEVSCFDLNALIRESWKLIRRLITEDIEVTADINDEELKVTGDAGLVQQILFNLVTNARDAISSQGHIHISTAATQIDEAFRRTQGVDAPAGCYVQFTVSDNGCGISDEIRAKIFEPFFTTKEVSKGTGLGLAMIHGTVKQMEGFIVVDSQFRMGTAFNIYIPASAGNEDENGESNHQHPDMTGHHELLLLVEDEDAVRDSLSHILELYSYRVLLAANADEALSLVHKYGLEIRLAIMDIILPGMNGMELAARIRTICPDLPVLFLSGYSDDVLKSKGISSVYLHKPVHPVQLLQQVRNQLDHYENTKTKGANNVAYTAG